MIVSGNLDFAGNQLAGLSEIPETICTQLIESCKRGGDV